MNRRHFLQHTGLSAAALAGNAGPAHFSAKAKRVIYLFMAGGPSQIDLFDPKPKLQAMFDQDLPASVRQGQRVTNMTARQSRFPIAPSVFGFNKHGQAGTEISELLPQLGSVADDLAIIKTVHTEAINHDPAKTMMCTGSQLPGEASIGAWVSFGLGGLNDDLPNFIVLNSAKWSGKVNVQGLYSRLWGAGYLPAQHQGVTFQPSGAPVLYLDNPHGVDRQARRKMLDLTGALNRRHLAGIGDPEIATTIAQHEMAYRMQATVPELTDTAAEPEHVRALYGPEVDKPGTFAHNCLLARRMVERDVRFVQIFHRGWDHHGKLPPNLIGQCRDIDHPCKGLLLDLKQRGLLDDTLVVWGGEFGRTVFCQGKLSREMYGRDHHPRCFSMWMAGGGVKGGVVHGETDDFSYNIVRDPVHVRDLNATILHQLGIDHNRLSFPHNGLDARLTGVEEAHVVKGILS
ncbi:MAG: hypothetical protein ACI8W8_002448 [Rhodothermales bacterium]|jgi:hypothetical protein